MVYRWCFSHHVVTTLTNVTETNNLYKVKPFRWIFIGTYTTSFRHTTIPTHNFFSFLRSVAEGVVTLFDRFDTNKDRELDMHETLDLLNSKDVKLNLANYGVDHVIRTPQDIEEAFLLADGDKNGRLSKTEFIALYIRLALGRVQVEPKLIVLAVATALDTNRDGHLDGKELKVLIRIIAPGLALASFALPDKVRVPYRKYLGSATDSRE